MRNRKYMVWFICSVILLLAGCSTSPQVIRLDLQPKVRSSSVGQQVPVVVRVRDKRPDKVIGYQTSQYGKTQGPIVALHDVSKTIYETLAKGLRKKGFVVDKYAGPSKAKPSLTVTLQTLSYSRSHDQINVEAKLKAHVEMPGKKYSFTYIVRKKKGRDLLRSKKENAKLINSALNEVLNNLLNDRELISILAGHDMQNS